MLQVITEQYGKGKVAAVPKHYSMKAYRRRGDTIE
jgi:hypothetical protein